VADKPPGNLVIVLVKKGSPILVKREKKQKEAIQPKEGKHGQKIRRKKHRRRIMCGYGGRVLRFAGWLRQRWMEEKAATDRIGQRLSLKTKKRECGSSQSGNTGEGTPDRLLNSSRRLKYLGNGKEKKPQLLSQPSAPSEPRGGGSKRSSHRKLTSSGW